MILHLRGILQKNENFFEMIIYFKLIKLKGIDNAEKFVMELNQSTWTDYLTGLMTALSLNKNRFGVRTSLEIPEIQKDGENYKTYSEFIKKLATRYQPDKIIDLDLLNDVEWQKENNDFLSYSKIVSIAKFDTKEIFEMFKQHLRTKSF